MNQWRILKDIKSYWKSGERILDQANQCLKILYVFGTQCQRATFGTHRVFYHYYLLICSTFRSWWTELGTWRKQCCKTWRLWTKDTEHEYQQWEHAYSILGYNFKTTWECPPINETPHNTLGRHNTRFCSSDPFPFVWQIHVWYSFPRPDHRADLCGDTNSTAASNHVLFSIGQLCHHRQPRSQWRGQGNQPRSDISDIFSYI